MIHSRYLSLILRSAPALWPSTRLMELGGPLRLRAALPAVVTHAFRVIAARPGAIGRPLRGE